MVLRALQFLNALTKGPSPTTEVKELKSTEVRDVHPVKAPLKQPVLPAPSSELKSTEVREVQYWKALRNWYKPPPKVVTELKSAEVITELIKAELNASVPVTLVNELKLNEVKRPHW